MGRRSDPPGLQEAKGYPGKRKTKADRQLEEAERLAERLAAAPSDGDALAPPMFIDASAKGALAVWKDYAPRLSAIHLLDPLFRHSFAMFCVYAAEFVQANDDVLANGHYRLVKTVSGDRMPRLNPMLAVRDQAAVKVLELSKRFGLSPMDQIALFKDHAAAAGANALGGLFGRPAQSAEAEQPAGAVEGPDPVGIMAGFDSKPPTARSH